VVRLNNTLFKLGHSPPLDSTFVCKVCKVPPTCINFCDASIYYVLGKSDITSTCIHLGMHNHPVSDGICQETLDTIFALITQEVSKTPTAKVIAMAASKEFLDKYFFIVVLDPRRCFKARNWRTSWTSLDT
jgi:hypothetical protein